jgi:outer membrane protein assembly factor BamB
VVPWSSLIEPGQATEVVQAATTAGLVLLVASGEHVHALEPASGKTVWSRSLGMAVDATPVAVDGRCLALGIDGTPVVLDLATGAVVRELEVDFVLDATPVVGGGLAVFEETSFSGLEPESFLHALDVATLTVKWVARYPFGTATMPAADAERVYVAVADGVRALNLADGKPAWSHLGARTLGRQGPVVRDGRVFIASGGLGQWTARCLEAPTGKVLWSRDLGDRLSGGFAATQDELLMPTMSSTLLRVSAKDGSLVGHVKLRARCDVRPAVAPGRVYLAAKNAVDALDRRSFERLWGVELDSDVASLSIAGDRVLVTRFDGYVHAIGR